MLKLVILALLFLNLNATVFKVASYNVENLFDLNYDKNEYKEYIPNTKSNWNKETYQSKFSNILKVIKELDADILALQEIENENILKQIQKQIPKYKYISFTKYKKSSIGLGFLSKYEIVDEKNIDVNFKDKLFRPILETTFKIDNIEFKIFNNHWPSKRVDESYRIKYAKKLKNRLDTIARDYDYILLGDFNSNYNENQTFLFNKKLNTTWGITGINQVLNTFTQEKNVDLFYMKNNKENIHYNLWIQLENKDRFSNIYRNENQTPDNILLNPALFDNKKISYIKDSFSVYKPSFLIKNKKINRWNIKNKIHQNSGYSDHLPIYALFSTNKNDRNQLKSYTQNQINKISDLYNIENINEPIVLKDVIILYKTDYSSIVKQKDDRAIYIYKNVDKLKLGFSYDLEIYKIKNFNGLKEITDFKIINEKNFIDNYKDFYIDVSELNFFDFSNQNEIITDLKAIYKNGYIHFKNEKIKLYAKEKSLLPKNNQNITIISGHLAVYKGNIQIIIYKKDDYKEN